MNTIIRGAIENGRLILLFGAGASATSLDIDGNFLLSGGKLAKLVSEEVGWTYSGEPLSTVYAAAKNVLAERLNILFENRYKHCRPSEEYLTIAKYAWARIYTLNVDDALDKALQRMSPQLINVRHKSDKVSDQNQVFRFLDYVKLNGSIDRLSDGLVFSPREYGVASSAPPMWYGELAEDFFRFTFLFIGTRINEPLFYHQIERYRFQAGSIDQKSFVLTPTATDIEKASLASYNLEHISGTLKDFASWLIATFPDPLNPLELAIRRNPALGRMLSLKKVEEREKYTSIFDQVTPVSRVYLSKPGVPEWPEGKIRNFYRGFKPTWKDVLDEVPATIRATRDFCNVIFRSLEDGKKFVVIHGPAGTGKTTLMKQAALTISDSKDTPVFYIDTPVDNLIDIISQLEDIHRKRFCIFYDRIDGIKEDLEEALERGLLNKGLFIGSERQHSWQGVVKDRLGKYVEQIFHVSLIDKNDARLILDKVRDFGTWTRLGKMTPNGRINELVGKAKRQLLIGLLETTYGIGFERIIESEFSQIGKTPERTFFMLVGLATLHRLSVLDALISRALTNLGIGVGISQLTKNLGGVVYHETGRLYARHPVYVRHVFNEVIETKDIFSALHALIKGYTVYESPVIKRVAKNERILFKSLINHRFVKYIFRSNHNYILNLYESFEKMFHNDGLFWLQYGLALRDLGQQNGALEKLQTAVDAYLQPHTQHALAQQQMIIACKIGSKAKAYNLLEKAKDTLEYLDKTRIPFNMFPIVTLSEGHTFIVRLYEGDEKGQLIAKQYANIIAGRLKETEAGRLKKSWVRLTTYVTRGEWLQEDEEAFLY